MLWYYAVKAYLKTTLYFYFKKIVVVGKDNIPQKEAVLFVSNHQNALLDPLVIAVSNKRYCYYLTRASVFKNPIVKRLLQSVNMLPIYRIRDGWQSLDKNKVVFKSCFRILNRKKSLLIFPEGNHSINRRVRPLSKGFTKILYGALAENPQLKIYIVPVGLNYSEHTQYPQSVAVYYGKAFLTNPFFDKDNKPQSALKLTQKVYEELQLLTTHIDDLTLHNTKVAQLKALETDFLNPIKTNKLLQKISEKQIENPKTKTPYLFFRIVYVLVLLFSWLPYLIWRYIKPKISDKVFTGTYRYAVAAVLIPLFCLVQSYLIYLYVGFTESLLFMAFCITLFLFLKWLPQHRQQ